MTRFDASRGGPVPPRRNRKHGVAAGLVLAAASLFGQPSSALAAKPAPVATTSAPRPLDTSVEAFYAWRQDYPLWLSPNAGNAADELLALLQSASIDGIDPGKYQLDGLRAALAQVRAMRPGKKDTRRAIARVDRMLSHAFIAYATDLRRPARQDVIYVEEHLKPQPPVARFLLESAARAPSPSAYLQSFAWVNPIYAELRRALAEQRYDGAQRRALLALNLERARMLPVTNQRHIVVNAAQQKLFAFEGGKRVDEMRVVVGKPKNPTPMMVALIRYAALNPYWYVPPDLTAERIAPRVLRRGLSYLDELGYQVLSDWSESAAVIDPKTVDWKAVAAGKTEIFVRQLPGPHNSMGRMKFMFPNEAGIYLHDNPERELFSEASRLYSGGCVRLEDAQRLGHWMFGRTLDWEKASAEQQTPLDRPVPVYITYLTAVPDPSGAIAYYEDVYGRDRETLSALEGKPPPVGSR